MVERNIWMIYYFTYFILIGVSMRKHIMTAALAALFSSGLHAWEIEGATRLDVHQLKAAIESIQDPQQAGQRIADLYREAGFLSIVVRVDPDHGSIRVIEAPIRASGSYADYIESGVVLSRDAIELASARMRTAARFNGERVDLRLSKIDSDGYLGLFAQGEPVAESDQSGGNVIFSTLGQRYSGPDVLTAYGWANVGDAQQLDASVSHAFSDWREDSRDGRFNNLTLGYRKASPWGLTSVQVMHSRYKTGGEAALIDAGGTVTRMNMDHSYLFTPTFEATARLSWVDNEQEIGVLDWTDRQRFTALTLSGRQNFAFEGMTAMIEASIERGLSGTRSVSDYPLMGEFDPHFNVVSARAQVSRSFGSGWQSTLKLGAQSGSDGTPSASQFYLGGPDRGRSYNTGYVAMPDGHFAALSLNGPTFHDVTPYMGLEYAKGKPIVGDDRTARSAYVGAYWRIQDRFGIDLSYAHALGEHDDPTGHRGRWLINASGAF